MSPGRYPPQAEIFGTKSPSPDPSDRAQVCPAINKSNWIFCFQPAVGNGEVKGTVTSDLLELRKSVTQVTDAMAPVKKYLEQIVEDTFRNDQWRLIFDRIDMILFISYQIVNTLAILYVYIASF